MAGFITTFLQTDFILVFLCFFSSFVFVKMSLNLHNQPLIFYQMLCSSMVIRFELFHKGFFVNKAIIFICIRVWVLGH